MKGVSDNNAQKKINSKGNQSKLKKPLQVLSLNKKTDCDDTSKNSSVNEKISNNFKDYELENERLIETPLEKESRYEKSEQSNPKFNKLEKPHIPIDENNELEYERTVDDFDFDEDQFLEALNNNEPIGRRSTSN